MPPWPDETSTRPIGKTNIVLGDLGRLGTDGLVYKALPDDTTADVTPVVDGVDFYAFDLNPVKHHPYITANGINLETNTPEFCVGQKVNLQLN